MNQLAGRRPEEEIERYLAEVTARLPRPGRTRTGIVAELRSGLLDAADCHQAAGLAPADAVQAAIREFGDPALVADGFLPEVAAGHARRVATALLLTGPLVGMLWLATAAASHPAIRIAVFWQWTTLPAGLGAGLQLVAVAVAVTASAAAAGIAVTGRLSRWLPAAPRRAPLAAAIAGFGAVAADGLGLVLLATELAAAPGRLSPLPAARGRRRQRGPAAAGQARRAPLPGHARHPGPWLNGPADALSPPFPPARPPRARAPRTSAPARPG
jgi:HAAS domain-containing protein